MEVSQQLSAPYDQEPKGVMYLQNRWLKSSHGWVQIIKTAALIDEHQMEESLHKK